ncbi:unnamed protein product [Blepharisma stoltei]|uniref:GAR domain-containing protein n=1 Tax=Blepharisma stoltei TaxID=1481888 RepID=A0AAU9JRW4_9CILI|nr:unnamed protein product [Blepharisma stoltei]
MSSPDAKERGFKGFNDELTKIRNSEQTFDRNDDFSSLSPSKNSYEIEYFQNIIKSQQAKLSNKEKVEFELNELRAIVEQSNKSRQDLQMSINETTEQLTNQLRSQSAIIDKLIDERDKAIAGLRKEQAVSKNLALSEEKLKARIMELEGNQEILHSKLNEAAETERMLEDVRKQLENSMKWKEILAQRFDKAIEDFEVRSNEYESRIKDLTQEKLELLTRIESLQSQNHELKNENDRLTNALLQMKALMTQLSAKAHRNEALAQKDQEQKALISSQDTMIKKLKEDLSKSIQNFKEKLDQLNINVSQLLQDKKSLNTEISSLTQKIDTKDTEIYKFSKQAEDLQAELTSLEQHLCVQEDLNSLLDQISEQKDQALQMKDQIAQELNQMTDLFAIESHKNKANCETIEQLKENLKERELEIEELREVITELQKEREVYLPVKDDPIDIALADYVNTRQDPLDVPFTREDLGIYLFGTKRVFVKLERGKVVVRVGGGFMVLEEFLEVYTPVELEKFESRQREKAQGIRREILGKYADTLITAEKPQKSPEMSPERASKMIKDQMAKGKYATFYATKRRGTSPPKQSQSPSLLNKQVSFKELSRNFDQA